MTVLNNDDYKFALRYSLYRYVIKRTARTIAVGDVDVISVIKIINNTGISLRIQ